MKLAYKVWLESEGGRSFGEGPYRLLRGVEITGSLWEAAVALGMAYSRARRVIAGCERRLGFSLTDRRKGGVSGGGSTVTDRAIDLMKAYESLRGEIEDAIGEAYKKHFGQSVQVQLYTVTPHKRGGKKATE